MINAVFEHEDGYKFNEVYDTKAQFLRAERRKGAILVHAIDVDRAYVIYPSNLPDYKRSH
mgnify:CR=1 FL=1